MRPDRQKLHHSAIVFPREKDLLARIKRLKKFEPLSLRSLLAEVKKRRPGDIDGGIVQALRSRITSQLEKLLLSLGIDPSRHDAFERGFLKLAVLYFGVGHLVIHPTNKNSVTWQLADDLELLRQVDLRTQQGMSERAAINAIAADRKLAKRFPHRLKGHAYERSEVKKRADALRARLQNLKRRSDSKEGLRRAFGLPPERLSGLEVALSEFDIAQFLSCLPTLANYE